MMSAREIKQFIKAFRQDTDAAPARFREAVLAVFAAKNLLDIGRLSMTALDAASFCEKPALSTCFALWQGGPLPVSDQWEAAPPPEINETAAAHVREFLRAKQSLPPAQTLLTLYPIFLSEKTRKKGGVFYTPEALARDMAADLAVLPSWRVIDPACGTGVLLLAIYQKWREAGARHEDCLNALWGIDTDGFAVLVAKCALTLQGETYFYPPHICQGDALFDLDTLQGQFDGIIANPPYIGHKQIASAQMERLRARYPSVYADKGNLMHCFFALAGKLLKPGGRAVFLTTRYYANAQNAAGLRAALTKDFVVEKIVDFYGARPFSGVGIDPMLTVLRKTGERQSTWVFRFNHHSGHFDQFAVKLTGADWSLSTPAEQALVAVIENAPDVTALKNAAASFQGIITGCDAAFVTDAKTAENLTGCQAYPWIKNSDVDCFDIKKAKKRVLYFETITKENLAMLAPYRDKLSRRRECLAGRIAWWQWQWGRERADFDAPKLIFPYKAEKNRFALDTAGRRFSADVYALLAEKIPLKGLCVLLNTPLYDAYAKIIIKKLGERLYEYYPNQVMRLKIPAPGSPIYWQLERDYDIIVSQSGEGRRAALFDANARVCQFFGIGEKQRKAIENAYAKHFF